LLKSFLVLQKGFFRSIALILYIPDPGKIFPVDSFYPRGLFLTQPQNRLSGLASRMTSQRIAAFAVFLR
ncbi:hypothetical protein BB513_RS25850, partial [Escherichia coli]